MPGLWEGGFSLRLTCFPQRVRRGLGMRAQNMSHPVKASVGTHMYFALKENCLDNDNAGVMNVPRLSDSTPAL